jgi:RNA polymerase sigma-70 factor (sigma-E family)
MPGTPAHRTVEAETSATDVAPDRIAELYASHVQEAARLAYFLVGDRTAAEDLVQDAFVRVFARFQHLRNDLAFRPYLHRTIVNLARKQFRRRRVEQLFIQGERGRPTLPQAQPDLETRDELWAALQALPERQRVTLVLRYYADLSEDQTADVMRCSRAAVNSLAGRGIAAMRERIGSAED